MTLQWQAKVVNPFIHNVPNPETKSFAVWCDKLYMLCVARFGIICTIQKTWKTLKSVTFSKVAD